MTWFFFALIGPLLYAMTNLIDKIILDKYLKNDNRSVGTILLFSAAFSAFALPFFFFADKTIFAVGGLQIFILAIVGILNALVLLFYLIAIKDEEASIVVVFYQLVPVIGSILSYFIIGEILTKMQIIAMFIVILGTTIISFEVDAESKFRLRKKTILPMLVAAFCWALGSVLFKLVALEENVWRSLFWEHLMLAVIGISIFVFMRSYRSYFLSVIRNNSKVIVSLSFLNEALYVSGNVIIALAYMLAPLGLVLLTESFQPIFVLAIGIFLTIFFPKILKEKVKAKHLLQKIIAICITGIGTYLLLMG